MAVASIEPRPGIEDHGPSVHDRERRRIRIVDPAARDHRSRVHQQTAADWRQRYRPSHEAQTPEGPPDTGPGDGPILLDIEIWFG